MPHTPGPWEVHHWGDNEGDIHSSDGKLVCVMRDGATAQEEDWEGDARLIAAAPDLLHCVLLLDYACHHGDGECLEAAVAKAKTLIAAAGQKTAEEEEDEEEDQ